MIPSSSALAVRPAVPADLPAILPVLEAAKGIMRASGNLHQWVNGYPSEDVIRDDISKGHGFVVVDSGFGGSAFVDAGSGGCVAGYFAFIPSPEPTYAAIYDGAWLDDTLPYHVVHRIASLPQVHGVLRRILDYCFGVDPNIRIDTHRDNRIMQHGLLKYGFRYCGIIYLASGDERLAYQRICR
jgi:hypothetical protein